jgi:RNA polymerase sigma factor (sigma-70 family)
MPNRSDTELLRDYARHGNEIAFKEIVARHADLVYAAALRQAGSPELAREVSQQVFTDLARKASSLSSMPNREASIVGWLYRGTRLECLAQRRSEQRRLARERKVMEEFNPISDPAQEWESIQPFLDEAMANLSEEDRAALLLRFFKNHDFRAIGAALGVTDDTAQKRVARALERLRSGLARRGATVTVIALGAAISANAVPLGPVGLATSLSSAALAGSAVASTAAAITTKALFMTTMQKTVVAVCLAAAIGTGIYEAKRASRLHNEMLLLRKTPNADLSAGSPSNAELERATKLLASLREENEQLRKNAADVPRLRGEVAVLRGQVKDLTRPTWAPTSDSTEIAAAAWVDRVKQLKERLDLKPEAKIPELQYLTEQDWLSAASSKLNSEKDYRRAFSSLRNAGENKFINKLHDALRKYLQANEKQFPTDMSQLQNYFETPVDAAILDRYAILPAEEIPNMKVGGKWIISQKAAVDEEFDNRMGVGPSGYGSIGSQWHDPLAGAVKTLEPVMKAYAAANDGREPLDPSELAPYLKTPAQQAAFAQAVKFLEQRREKAKQ